MDVYASFPTTISTFYERKYYHHILKKKKNSTFNIHTVLHIGLLAKIMIYCYSATKLCLALCNLMDCSMPVFPILHYLPEFVQIHAH